jgi:hypothetical protein
MYKVIRQDVRPNLDVPFGTEDFLNISVTTRLYLMTTHSDKFINISSENSPDGLTQTTTIIYASKDAYLAFTEDPEVIENIINKPKEYNDANGIIRTRISEEEII